MEEQATFVSAQDSAIIEEKHELCARGEEIDASKYTLKPEFVSSESVVEVDSQEAAEELEAEANIGHVQSAEQDQLALRAELEVPAHEEAAHYCAVESESTVNDGETLCAKDVSAGVDVEDDVSTDVSSEQKSISADAEHVEVPKSVRFKVEELDHTPQENDDTVADGVHVVVDNECEAEDVIPVPNCEEVIVANEECKAGARSEEVDEQAHESGHAHTDEGHEETAEAISEVIHESLRAHEAVSPAPVKVSVEDICEEEASAPVCVEAVAPAVVAASATAGPVVQCTVADDGLFSSHDRVHHPRPALNGKVVAWKGVTYSSYDDSEDEFELSTCRCPVFQQNENEDGSCSFKNGAPAMIGEVTSCFEEPNLLYRVVDAQSKTWAFYNDSLMYEVHIEFTFGKHSHLRALDRTAMTRNVDGSWCATVVVYPTETERFIKGRVNGFTSKLRALPLSDDYHRACRRQYEVEIQEQIAAIRRVCTSHRSEDVLQACIEHNLPFVDVEFPPCQASLDRGSRKSFRPLAWARPRSYLSDELADQVRLFRGDINPGRVEPGELGDSWLLCAMACVSENQDWLRSLFRHPSGKAWAQREHAIGAYRVSFNKHGMWHCVIVDDYLPVSAGVPKYARSADDPAEIWPCILQKALAKLYGSYSRIGTGDPLHAMTDMTGFAHFRFDDAIAASSSHNSAEAVASGSASVDLGGKSLRATVLHALGAGYTVMMSTPTLNQASQRFELARRRDKDGNGAPALTEGQIAEKYQSVGLVMGHAYTILNAKEFVEHDICLLRVRSIWGRGVKWHGPWHGGDVRWQEYPDVAEACASADEAVEDDETFWMPWESAMDHFTGGGICYGQPFVYDYRVPGVFNDTIPSVMFEIQVVAPTWMTLVLSQTDHRFIARTHMEDSPVHSRKPSSEQEHAPLMVSICTPSEENMMRVAMNSTVNCELPSEDRWTFLQAREVSVVHRFDPGRYLVVPRTMALDGQPSELPFTLGLITDQEIGENGAATVQCVSLPASSNVFENFAQFEDDLIPCGATKYQKRLLNGCVQNLVASSGLQ